MVSAGRSPQARRVKRTDRPGPRRPTPRHWSTHPLDTGHARQRRVLAALLVEVNRPVPVDELIDRVWADRPPHRARNALSAYLSRLRQQLLPAPDVRIERVARGYRLAVDPLAVDLHRFRHLVRQARSADAPTAATLYDQALELWRGEPLAGIDTPWFAGVRTSLQAERLAAELDRNDAALRAGRHADRSPARRRAAGAPPPSGLPATDCSPSSQRPAGRRPDTYRGCAAAARRAGADPGGAGGPCTSRSWPATPTSPRSPRRPAPRPRRCGAPTPWHPSLPVSPLERANRCAGSTAAGRGHRGGALVSGGGRGASPRFRGVRGAGRSDVRVLFARATLC